MDTVAVKDHMVTLTLKEPVNGKSTVTYEIYSFDLFYDDFNAMIVRQWERGIICYGLSQ